MKDFEISVPSYEEADYIEEMLIRHNNEMKSFEQEAPFIAINRCIKDENGNIIAGIISYSVMWKILYIDTLWVNKNYRMQGIGTKLLNIVEEEGKRIGCYMSHLDCFDFQGKEFYIKNNYNIFGVLEEVPKEHCDYFLYKKL